MKNIVIILLLGFFIFACSGSKNKPVTTDNQVVVNDTIRIANEELEYEVIIIEPGFYAWLNSQAKPRGFYSQNYLEARNRAWVIEYNNRVLQPMRYDPNLYSMQIDYRNTIDYGYEVNFLLYNYFVFFQQRYNQRFGFYNPGY
jgi:Family of unknown function (DUF6146)